MNRSGWWSHLTALITAILASICLLRLSSSPAWAKVGTITEFPIPTASSLPEGITAGPDGNLWFAEFNVGNIGRITTKGKITEFHVASVSSGSFGITAGPDGNLWFTLSFGNSIGCITTGGSVTTFPLPTTCGNKFGCGPLGITAGPAHNSDVWFTEIRGPRSGA